MKPTTTLLLLVAPFLAALPITALSQAPLPANGTLKPEEVKKNSGSASYFVLSGTSAADRPPTVEPKVGKSAKGVPTWRWTKYDYIQCDVAWDEECSGDWRIDAPPEWQICKLYYSVGHESGYRYGKSTSPTGWYTNDPQSPDRFRSYSLSLSAKGSQSIFYKVGARIQLTNVGIEMIPASAENNSRYEAGCEMPAHD